MSLENMLQCMEKCFATVIFKDTEDIVDVFTNEVPMGSQKGLELVKICIQNLETTTWVFLVRRFSVIFLANVCGCVKLPKKE